MTELLIEALKVLAEVIKLVTAILGLSVARKQRPRRKKKGHRQKR